MISVVMVKHSKEETLIKGNPKMEIVTLMEEILLKMEEMTLLMII